jgi:methylphosphotriester-DNA--protein-cysteine methyltransferase
MKKVLISIAIIGFMITAVSAVQYNKTHNSIKTEECYCASTKSRVFHYCSCRSAKKIKPDNFIEFNTREDAIETGRRPCKVCKP